MRMPYLTNTQGEKSASLTMSIISFVIVTLWLLLWLITTPLGIPFPPFDAGAAMAYLSPILALYFGRRWTAHGPRRPLDEEYDRDRYWDRDCDRDRYWDRDRDRYRDRYRDDDYGYYGPIESAERPESVSYPANEDDAEDVS